MLRPVTAKDLEAHPKFADVLELIPSDGHVTFEVFRRVGADHATYGVARACSIGVLKRMPPHWRIMDLESVKFWATQLNDPGHKNVEAKRGTKYSYLNKLAKFDEWLSGRSFPLNGIKLQDWPVPADGMVSFESVEALMQWCNQHDFSAKVLHRIAREYLAIPQVTKMSASVNATIRTAIKSYFGVHDIMLNLPKIRKKRSEDIREDPPMALENFYKMLQNGKPGLMMRAVLLVKFQSGMDAATLTDRFNYDGYRQLVKWFGTEMHAAWNLGLCPVQITLVRVKTGMHSRGHFNPIT